MVVFGRERGTEGQDLAYERRNRGTYVAPRCGLSGNSRNVPPYCVSACIFSRFHCLRSSLDQ